MFSLPQGLRTDPQGTPTLKDWGEEEKPAKQTEKEQSRRNKGSQESVVSWKPSDGKVLKGGSDLLIHIC